LIKRARAPEMLQSFVHLQNWHLDSPQQMKTGTLISRPYLFDGFNHLEKYESQWEG
jgi:hypothetical protein